MTNPGPVIHDSGAGATDSYLTIVSASENEIKVLGSRFLAFAFPAATPEEAAAALDALRRRWHDATHHCWAWRIGMDTEHFRFSDDGEPSGTAGRRILGSLDRLSLTDIMVVVVRYFGGTKLGVGGLSRAYSDAADAALSVARTERRFITASLVLTFPYDMTSQVHHVLETAGAEILDRAWGDDATYTVRIRRSHADALCTRLVDATERRIVIGVL